MYRRVLAFTIAICISACVPAFSQTSPDVELLLEKGRKMLDYMATAALAVPGVVLGIGYLRLFHSFEVPVIGQPLASWWVIIVIALTINFIGDGLRDAFDPRQNRVRE